MASTLTVDNIVGATTAANVKLPGAVIQTVTTELNTTSGAGSITSASYTELTGLRCTITPKLTGSKIYYRANIMCGNNNAGGTWFNTRLQVGGTVISEERGFSLENADLEMLGTAETVTIDKDNTTIVNGAGKASDIKARVN